MNSQGERVSRPMTGPESLSKVQVFHARPLAIRDPKEAPTAAANAMVPLCSAARSASTTSPRHCWHRDGSTSAKRYAATTSRARRRTSCANSPAAGSPTINSAPVYRDARLPEENPAHSRPWVATRRHGGITNTNTNTNTGAAAPSIAFPTSHFAAGSRADLPAFLFPQSRGRHSRHGACGRNTPRAARAGRLHPILTCGSIELLAPSLTRRDVTRERPRG